MKKTLLLLSLVIFYGCGYKIGSYIQEQKSIAIPIAYNNTLYREYEFYLTKSLISQILTSTSLKLLPKEKADTILEVEILKINQNTIIKDENREAKQLDLTLVVEINWKDNLSHKSLIKNKKIIETIEINRERGEKLEEGILKGIKKISKKIIYIMENLYWNKKYKS